MFYTFCQLYGDNRKWNKNILENKLKLTALTMDHKRQAVI